MIFIENIIEKVLVLKAFNYPDIRILPGFNEIDANNIKELEPYFTSDAAKGLFKGYKKHVFDYEKKGVNETIRINKDKQIETVVKVRPVIRFVDEDQLDEGEKEDAAYARKKNDRLNKATFRIRKTSNKIDSKDKLLSDQQKQINELTKLVKALQPKTKSKNK